MKIHSPGLKLYSVYGITQDHDSTSVEEVRFYQYGTDPENAILNRKILERRLSGDRYSFIATRAVLAESRLPVARCGGIPPATQGEEKSSPDPIPSIPSVTVPAHWSERINLLASRAYPQEPEVLL